MTTINNTIQACGLRRTQIWIAHLTDDRQIDESDIGNTGNLKTYISPQKIYFDLLINHLTFLRAVLDDQDYYTI